MEKYETATTVLTDLKRTFEDAAAVNRQTPEEEVYAAFATEIKGIVGTLASSDGSARLKAIASMKELKTQFDNVVTRNTTGPFPSDAEQKSMQYSIYSETVSKALKLI